MNKLDFQIVNFFLKIEKIYIIHFVNVEANPMLG